MSVLASCKSLRGTVFDLFGYTAERKAERAALTRYEALLDEVAARLTAANYTAAVQLVSVPEQIRGFGLCVMPILLPLIRCMRQHRLNLTRL